MPAGVDKPLPSQSVATAASVPFWIDGRRVGPRSTRSGNVTNPATGEVTRIVPFAGGEDVDLAVRAAVAAFPAWRSTPPLRRARILTRFRELMEQHQTELASIVTDEHGKVLLDATGSVQRGIEVIEFAAGAPTCSKASTPGPSAAEWMRIHACSPSACARGSRRSIFR